MPGMVELALVHLALAGLADVEDGVAGRIGGAGVGAGEDVVERGVAVEDLEGRAGDDGEDVGLVAAADLLDFGLGRRAGVLGANLGSTIQTTTSPSWPLGPTFQFSVWRTGLSPQPLAAAMKVVSGLLGAPWSVTVAVTSARAAQGGRPQGRARQAAQGKAGARPTATSRSSSS